MAEAAANNFKVSANGGAGSAGQPAQYMSNDYERTGDAGNMELQTSAMMNKSGVNVPTAPAGRAAPQEPLTPLDALTQRPDEPVSHGADAGPGAGSNILPSTMMLDAQNNEDVAKLAAFLPMYARIAESPNATNSTRNFYRFLRTLV
jgi:hypothetical protein